VKVSGSIRVKRWKRFVVSTPGVEQTFMSAVKSLITPASAPEVSDFIMPVRQSEQQGDFGNLACPRERHRSFPCSLPLEMPSRIPRASTIRTAARIGAGEGTAPLQTRVSQQPLFHSATTTNLRPGQSARNPNSPAPEARRDVSPP
jgi:hypothetical protein